MRIASEFRLLAPLAVTAVAATAVFVLSLVIWSFQVDADARAREESLLQQGVLAQVSELEKAVGAQIRGDRGVERLAEGADLAWARSILPTDLGQTAEFDDVVVLDGGDRRVFPAAGATPKSLGATGLVAEVRRAEALAAPAGPVSEAIQRSAFSTEGGRVRLVTATLVPPRAEPRAAGRSILVLTSQDLVPGLIELMRERFQLAPIRASVGAGRPPPGQASVAFTTTGGAPLVLAWAPQRPGAALLQRAIWPMLAILLGLGGAGLLMLHQARRAAHELLASNRAQTEFLANMSHEIRTPLNGVVAVADALARTQLTGQQGELVQIICTSGETLKRLLSDVLDLARIETGAVAIENEPFALGEALRAAAALHRHRAEEKGIGLVLRLDPAVETAVVGDQVRLKQILTNLLSNAIKFTKDGSVTLEASPVPDRPESWRFIVEDTGVGFDPAMRERIFGRFQQADGSVTRRFGGTGLGLAICKQLCELMGGTIEAHGRPGAGARFSLVLRLPRHQASIEPTGPAVESPPPIILERRLRVLLADDHPTNRRVVEVLLSDLELDLVTVENGLEACEQFEIAPFDAVLMDMQMPVMDGLTAMRRIRAFEAKTGLAPTFLAMLTANALRDHQEQSLGAGADIHLAKPIEAARLFAALALAGERAALREAA